VQIVNIEKLLQILENESEYLEHCVDNPFGKFYYQKYVIIFEFFITQFASSLSFEVNLDLPSSSICCL
jgi:hypothetical protein